MEANVLNRFCQKNGGSFEATFQQSAKGFQCTLRVPGVQKISLAVASSKKAAQATAVKDMVSFLEASGLLAQTLEEPSAKKRKSWGGAAAVASQPAPEQVLARKAPGTGAPLPPGIRAPGQCAGPARPQTAPALTPAKTPAQTFEGNFTLEIARGHLNEHLRKWRQPTEMQLLQQGPPHLPQFRATLLFEVKNERFFFSHTATNKKQVQNELALKVCRKLYALGLMREYKRNSTKGTFFDNLKDSKYFQAGTFGLGLQPALKAKLRAYLQQCGCEVHTGSLPPGSILWEGAGAPDLPTEPEIAALPWSPPSEGPDPWPEPKSELEPDTLAAAVAAEASASLPIASKYQEIIEAVANHQVCIIQGSTGSGKTTQVPQYILDAEDDGGPKTIVVTQPRRLAAITVARRVAQERGEALGGSVGYAVRFDSVWPQRPGGICYMTSGLLLKRLHQRGLCGISHVIVDEVHERDLDNDVLLGLLRSALSVHPGLKVVLMSATIDASKFQEYLQGLAHDYTQQIPPVPVVSVHGHNYDVKVLFLEDIIEKMRWVAPPKKKEKESEGSMNACDQRKYSASTVQALQALPEQQIPLELTRDLLAALVSEGTVSPETGSVLVFLPTWSKMSVLKKLLEAEQALSSCKIIMLHSQVPKEAQMEAFQPAPRGIAKVILATNIAESSLTIDDVTCVIDSCRVKLNFFSETTRLSYNDIVFTGRHNLEQRKGRAGRTRPGLCFRLCTRQRFEEGLEDEVPPELTRMPLVGAALLVKSLELGDIATVLSQCPDPPPEPAVAHAIAELQLVRAIDEDQELTNLGRILARLPLDPHVGLALLMGHWLFGLGDAMATLCAAMSFDEPFPFEKTTGYLPWSISEKYKGTHKNSDQFVLGLVHQDYARLLETHGSDVAARYCSKEGLHPAIMRQVYNASEQIRSLLHTPALGSLTSTFDEEDAGFGNKRSHTAIRDWSHQDWEWGAILLSLVTALPHLAVHQEKRHVWVAEDTVGAVYKGSINCCKNEYVFPSPIFAFLDQTKEEGWKPPRCRQLTNMPPLLALLKPFTSGNIRTDDQDGSCVIIGGWIPLGPVPADTAQLLLLLRSRLEDVLVECADTCLGCKVESSANAERLD
ncbi:unnamed protein product [Effrenium voratum]|nr:unnamed protein product [Effrenium voratum]